MRDRAHEEMVEHEHAVAAMMLQSAKTASERRVAWQRLKFWKAQRSPERIAELERERGIAP